MDIPQIIIIIEYNKMDKDLWEYDKIIIYKIKGDYLDREDLIKFIEDYFDYGDEIQVVLLPCNIFILKLIKYQTW